MADNRKKITIEIDNLTEAQALAIEDLLAQWQVLGGMGSSRWTAFYADGDGNFQPKVTVDGHKAEFCELGVPPKERWTQLWEENEYGNLNPHETYMIDFDAIAWALDKDK